MTQGLILPIILTELCNLVKVQRCGKAVKDTTDRRADAVLSYVDVTSTGWLKYVTAKGIT